MQMRTGFLIVLAVGSMASIGCGSGGASSTENTGTARASLHRAKGCGDLLSDLKADAAFKLNKGIDQQIQSIQRCVSKYGESRCTGYGYVGGGGRGLGMGEDSASGAPPPQASTPGDSNAEAGSYSETNTQVKGVDEADFVKNDGKNLYVLHGRTFKVLKAWPANELAELSSFDIEGTPQEMFVSDGKVVVYSQVNGAGIFAAAGVTPKEQYRDYYGSGGGAAEPAIDAPVRPGGSGQSSGPYVPLTKITVLTLDGATASVAREVYFEGSYLSSRRVNTHVRTVLQSFAHGPKLKYGIYELYPQDANGADPQNNPYPKTGTETVFALEQLRSQNLAAINASVLSDWLPYTFVKNGQAVSTQTVACEDFYVPTTGTTESGLTEVASLDLADPAATPRQTAILGRADTVYANSGTLYLAAHAWVEPPNVWFDEGGTTSSDGAVGNGGSAVPPETDTAPPPTPREGSNLGARSIRPQSSPATPSITTLSTNKTHIHKFEFATDPKFPNYVASGTVVGSVKNQFSLDDKDGMLRIATSENRMYVDSTGKYIQPSFDPSAPTQGRPNSVNRVFVLGQNGAWLDVVGDVGELAPNEQIYSVRFVESRGYVVTFRRVDPLFVVDLTAPTSPTVLAALKIPGFSEYMHPLDANHLLTIGRDATDQGQARGLQLQIFDVTDGAHPILQHKFTYTGSEYGQSEAEHDHKAFTYFADKKLLAFPYYAYGSGDGGMRSSLELFKVDLAAGFQQLGSIDHTALVSQAPQGYCGGLYGPSVRRGVFLENFVYSVSYGGVVVKNASDLAAEVGKVALPSPQVNPGYGPDGCF